MTSKPSSSQQQQQRTQLQQLFQQGPTPSQQTALQDEYLSAKQAAVEAVSIGRDTLEVVEQQGEQLEHMERTADDTKYMLEKSNRILRGMTWSGWVTNIFSKDPSTTSATAAALAKRIIPKVYEHVPSSARSAAQAVQNYHANLAVLLESAASLAKQQYAGSSEQKEQFDTCQMICDNMFQTAWLEVSQLQQNCSVDVVPFCQRLALDLAALRDRQKKACGSGSSPTTPSQLASTSSSQTQPHLQSRNELLGPSTPSKSTTATYAAAAAAVAVTPSDPHYQVQEEHLDFMAGHLDELRNIAHSMTHMMDHHTERLESLHGKADDNLEVSKLVTRRADRLIQAKSWSKARAVFHSFISIRHTESGCYMAVTPALPGTIVLSPQCHPETCVFAVWRRGPSSNNGKVVGLFGLQHQATQKWVGQSFLLGTLSCTGTKFGQREEWEADDDWTSSTLLCASAGWGHGAYLEVDATGTVRIGSGGTAEARAQAARWCLTELAAAR